MKVKGLGMVVFVMLSLMAGSIQVGNVVITGILSPAWSQEKVIKIDGSSTVYPITEAVAEEFQHAKKGTVKVTVGISGTGGGFKKFSRGETDISMPRDPLPKRRSMPAKRPASSISSFPLPMTAWQ